jgi:hypothetical protein
MTRPNYKNKLDFFVLKQSARAQFKPLKLKRQVHKLPTRADLTVP